MGASGSKIDQIQKINPNQWIALESKEQYDIVQHRISKTLAERTNILLDPKRQDDDQLAIYGFRNTSNAPIVKVEGIQKLEPKGTGICGNQRNLHVYYERIIKRFDEFPQLTFPESVYCLREALQGYRVLQRKAGVFEVNEDMMGINNEGQFKVWTNKNFGENHPNFQKPILQTTLNENLRQINQEKQMVQNVIEVIEEKNEEGRFPQDFKNRLMLSSESFSKCQNQLDDYLHDKRLNIPKKIHPNLQYVIEKRRQSIPVEVPVYNNPSEIRMNQILSNQGIRVDQGISSIRNTGVFRNTQRIETENRYLPQQHTYVSSQNQGQFIANKIQTNHYAVSNPVVVINKNEYETPKSDKFYNSIQANPNIAVAESVYQKPQISSFLNQSQQRNTNIMENCSIPTIYRFQQNNVITESNVASVNPDKFGYIHQRKTYTTSLNPQTTSNLNRQGPAKVSFSYKGQSPVQHSSQSYTYPKTNIGTQTIQYNIGSQAKEAVLTKE